MAEVKGMELVYCNTISGIRNLYKQSTMTDFFLLFFFSFFSLMKVCERSRSPDWNESFLFMVQNPREEMLVIKV